MRSVTFTLPFALPGLNVRDRTHWAARSRAKESLAQEIMVAIGGPRWFPRPPFERVRVTINRCSAGRLDPDNLVASAKDILDSLCVKSARHPHGLSIIVDDNSDRLELIVKQSSAAPTKGATIVRVEEIP